MKESAMEIEGRKGQIAILRRQGSSLVKNEETKEEDSKYHGRFDRGERVVV